MCVFVGAGKDVSIAGPQEGKEPAADVLEGAIFIPVVGTSGEKVLSQLLECGFYPVVIVSKNFHRSTLADTGAAVV